MLLGAFKEHMRSYHQTSQNGSVILNKLKIATNTISCNPKNRKFTKKRAKMDFTQNIIRNTRTLLQQYSIY